MSTLPAVILAGGRSSRMGGGDKSLLELRGRPIIAHVIERLKGGSDFIAINANGDAERFAGFDLPVLPDPTQSFDGPLAGIWVGLSWAGMLGASHLLTVSGDTPFFPTDLRARLTPTADDQTISVAASASGIHPTFALWPTALCPDLVDHLAAGQRRVSAFIARHPSIAVTFPDIDADGEQVDPFLNINTPEDLALARRLAERLLP